MLHGRLAQSSQKLIAKFVPPCCPAAVRAAAAALLLLLAAQPAAARQHSVARQWSEVTLTGIRNDLARPTVHARNLHHISAAMYDAWAAYDDTASPYFLSRSVGRHGCPFLGVRTPMDVKAAREEAISYAAYRLIAHRFRNSPRASETAAVRDARFEELGYDASFTDSDYGGGSAAALGNYIAGCIIAFGLQDGANEQDDYANLFYEPVNPPLVAKLPGNPDLVDPDRWQPLTLDAFIDQAGNLITFNTPEFLSPEWGAVVPFALSDGYRSVRKRDGSDFVLYHDTDGPPHRDETRPGLEDPYKWGFALVSTWSSHLDSTSSVLWDISPAAIGNLPELPTSIDEYPAFYDLIEGGDTSRGWDVNPRTGQPYESQWVPRADYARVLAEFWADGPDSETPPGHWFAILNYVSDHPALQKRYRGQGDVMADLEWDVKAYFALGGAMHDAAVTAWGAKGYHDYIRPISAIRALADLGQSSDAAGPSFHPNGLPLVDGLIELVAEGDPLAGPEGEHVGKVKLFAWRGPDYIINANTDVAGAGWILAENWWPYQRPTFVTPPFSGFVSGHSTFSRAAAEVLGAFTGDPFFPGGLGEFEAPAGEFLVFEDGPSVDVTLQWATYRDAADQCSLSRIWGGIHPPADDIPGRHMGRVIGLDAFAAADRYFKGDVAVGVEPVPAAGRAGAISVFPNPSAAGEAVTVYLGGGGAGGAGGAASPGTLSVHDVTGRLVATAETGGRDEVVLEAAALSAGVYLIRLIHADGVTHGRLVRR